MTYYDDLIIRKVPKEVRKRTQENMDKYYMCLYDAFNEAVRNYRKCNKELRAAFMVSDYRLYIPSAYSAEYMDFNKYPLMYDF